jgi:hypothetical protein
MDSEEIQFLAPPTVNPVHPTVTCVVVLGASLPAALGERHRRHLEEVVTEAACKHSLVVYL